MVIPVSYGIIDNSCINIPELPLVQRVSESKNILICCKIGARYLAPQAGILLHELFINDSQREVLGNTGLHSVNITGYNIGRINEKGTVVGVVLHNKH